MITDLTMHASISTAIKINLWPGIPPRYTIILMLGVEPMSALDNSNLIGEEDWGWEFVLASWGIILLVFLSFFFYHYRYASIKRMVLKVYSTLPRSEKDKISALEKEIESVLDPSLPGYSKHIKAWEEWSKADRMAVDGALRVRSMGPSLNPYCVVLSFLSDAELALRREKYATRSRDKYAMKAVEALELAAMMRGIYWPYEVARAMEIKNKKKVIISEEFVV